MGHIFISYSHADQEYVNKLHAAFLSEGFDAWIDGRIDYGDQWPKVIQKHLDECDAFIIVMSGNSYESEMVQNEITRAREKKKPIFPILLDDESWLIVQAKQYVDVRDGSLPTEKFYKRLEAVTPRKKVVISIPPPPPLDPPTPKQPLISKETIARLIAGILPAGRVLGAFLLIGMVVWAGSLAIPAISSWMPTSTKAPIVTTAPPPIKSPTLPPKIATPTRRSIPASASATATRTVVVSGSNKTSPIDAAKMVRIPGSGNVESFWIDQSAVTTSMFEKFVNATEYTTDAEKNGVGFVWTNLGEQPATQFPGQTGVVYEWKLVSAVNWKNPTREEWMGDQVLQVSWNDALAYCQWAGKELVTIEEWELARTSGLTFDFDADFGEWGENRTSGVYRVVLGRDDVKWGGYTTYLFQEKGFVEYRSANRLTFRCKEK